LLLIGTGPRIALVLFLGATADMEAVFGVLLVALFNQLTLEGLKNLGIIALDILHWPS
jgi:hypothetical protein